MPKTKISEFSSTPANNTDIDSINIAEGCAPSGINDAIRELMAQLKDWQSGTSNDPMVIGSSGSLTLNQGTANGVAYLNGSKVVTSGSALTFDGTKLGVGVASPVRRLDVSGQMRATSSTVFAEVDADSSTGVGYLGTASNHPIGFKLNDSEVGRWTSTGLGIGTSSPAYKLDVVGPVQSSAGYYINGNTGGGYVWVRDNYALRFGTNDTERMRIDSSGNLGLGVTPSAWGANFRALQLKDSSNLHGVFTSGNGATEVGSNYYNNGTNDIYTSSWLATKYRQLSGVHSWYTTATGTAGNAITFTQAMTLDASGNLALGTTSATGQASNNRVIQIYGAGTANRAQIHFCNSDTGETATDGSFIGVDTNRHFYIINREAADTIFENNGAERARIDSSGRLLVGTTSVPSSSSGGAAFVPSSVGRTLLKLGTTTTGGAGLVEFYNPNGMIGEISVNGSTTTYSTSSDYRLKNTIAPMTGALAKVALLKPCTYKWNADGSDGQGFIAHELAEVCPDAVTGEKDAVDEDGNPKYQGIDVSFLVATLTAALQELNAKFDAYVASHP